MFVGRTVAETATLLPMLFSICGKAQAAACATALERAARVQPNQMRSVARRRAVAVETIREHLWRMLLDWPRVLGEAPDRTAMATVLAACKRLLGMIDPNGRLFLPDIAGTVEDRVGIVPSEDLDALLDISVFGMSGADWLDQVCDEAMFRRWAQVTETVAARLMRSVIDRKDADLGRSSAPPLPDLADHELNACLQGPAGLEFLANPTWKGQPHETSPFARQSALPLLVSLKRRFGPGILSRLTSQLLEVASLAAAMHSPLERWAHAPNERDKLETGLGFGRADAARGLLVHRVALDGDRIRDYRILAPTEWNFHPRGVVAEALSNLPPADEAVLRRRAELIIMATDPCVAYDLVIAPQQPPV